MLGRVSEVSDRNGQLGELPVFWHEAPAPDGPAQASAGSGGRAPATPLYLHGVPTNSDEWIPFLKRTGGLAPDLPGFGRSGKPGHFPYTIEGYADFLERYLDLAEAERVSLVVHDWGVVGLVFAQRHPERVERLVVIDGVPFLPGYRWHRTARIWRTPLLGELAMGTTTRTTLRFVTRESNVKPGPLPDAWLQMALEHFDQGTQRAILHLYRGSPPETLAAAGAGLGKLSMPSLVIWGLADPYIPARFGRDYADVLPHSELLELPDAGHWPWLDRPETIDRVAEFLAGE
jgi:pimeloyl-ACP methyl ester carboxylesterase